MALNTQQIAGLNALNQKIAGGYTASQTDLDNLDYAKDQGYTYNPMPQGATKIASPDQLKGLTESQLYRSGQDIYRLPSTPSEVATNQPSPIIPPAEPTPSVDGLMAGVQTGNQGLQAQLESLQKQLTSQPKATALQAEQEKYRGEQATAQRDLQEQKFQQLGLNENLAQVQAIMPQIARLEADFNRIANENLNRPISSRIIGGTADRLQRQKAVELAGLSAVAQAYQGNVNLARNIANDAVNAQYQDIQTYNNNLQNQINSVYKDLDREEKVKADQIKEVIKERDRQIEEEKNNATAIQNLAIQSAQAGVDNTIVSNILKSGSISKAIEMAAKAGVYQFLDSTTPIKLTDDLFYDPITKTTKTAKQLTASQLGDKGITSASGNSYDMSTYATDPKQAQKVQSYLDEIGKFNSVEDIDAYIKSKYPNSQITGQMVAEVAAEQGVGWEEVVALAQHESLLGTSNVAKSNNNPGGITWNANFPESMKGTPRPGAEGGNYVKFNTMKDGLNSVAYELAKRKVEIVEQPTTTTEDGYDISKFTPEFYNTPFGQKVLNNEQQSFNSFKGEQIVKNYNDVQNKAASVQKIVDSGVGGPGDLALVFEFMKALDPTSVVRESEYDSAAKSGNIFAGAYARFNGYLKEKGGFLPDNVKQSFLDITNSKLDVIEGQYNNLRNEYRRIAATQGLNPENVAPNLTITQNNQSQTAESSWLSQQGVNTGTQSSTPLISEQPKSIWNEVRSWFNLKPQVPFWYDGKYKKSN